MNDMIPVNPLNEWLIFVICVTFVTTMIIFLT